MVSPTAAEMPGGKSAILLINARLSCLHDRSIKAPKDPEISFVNNTRFLRTSRPDDISCRPSGQVYEDARWRACPYTPFQVTASRCQSRSAACLT